MFWVFARDLLIWMGKTANFMTILSHCCNSTPWQVKIQNECCGTGRLVRSRITGHLELHYPGSLRRLKYGVSAMVTAVMLIVALMIMLMSLNLQGYVHHSNAWLYFPSLAKLSTPGWDVQMKKLSSIPTGCLWHTLMLTVNTESDRDVQPWCFSHSFVLALTICRFVGAVNHVKALHKVHMIYSFLSPETWCQVCYVSNALCFWKLIVKKPLHVMIS